MAYQFKRYFTLNNDYLDRAHQKLFDDINKVGKQNFSEILRLVKAHFDEEEATMAAAGCPDDILVAHKKQHERDYRNMEYYSTLPTDAYRKVITAMLAHIAGYDIMLHNWLESQNAKPTNTKQ